MVTGLLVTAFTASSRGWPHPGSFVSTTTAPVAAGKRAALPPPPLRTYSVSAILPVVMVFGAWAAGACDGAARGPPPPADVLPTTAPGSRSGYMLMEATLAARAPPHGASPPRGGRLPLAACRCPP